MNETTVAISPEEFGHILELQQSVFRLIVEGASRERVVDRACLLAEALVPRAVASYMHLDNATGLLNVRSAPTIPAEGVGRLNGLRPGPGSGSCGNAIYSNRPVYVCNAVDDARWANLRQFAFDFNVRACWSHPVYDAQRQAVGTFALTSFEQRQPSEFHKQLLEVVAALISIALLHEEHQLSLERERQHALRLLEQDRLTGLSNSVSLEQALTKSACQVLVLANLNNLSYLNTLYGLGFGDKLLCGVAERLRLFAPEGATVFRTSADEFAILYPQWRQDQLHSEVARLQQCFRAEPLWIDQLSLYMTFNIGVGCGADCQRQAMKALKRSRQMGKNRFFIYDNRVETVDGRQRNDYIQWNTRLHAALASGGIKPWYQGIRNNRSGAIEKWEVLVRLEDEQGIATPDQFLDIAKLCGLMPAITRAVIAGALQAIAGTARQISINITEEDLALGYLADFLDHYVERYAIEPRQVMLELLEGVSSNGKHDQIRQLQQLKQRGYRLAIDDFGTEYSNFERVLELDIDVLKIDSKYIRDIHHDRISYEIVRGIAFFARNTGIKTIAEFVHCAEVQAVVEALGIDESQGYLFSRPRPDFSLSDD